ncbi:MAG TPA: MAPEG family protein [Oleiagrimonas sp.]|nr:MAPEG family protein [Oleiagrimonas sp.]
MIHLPELVILLTVILLFATAFMTGRARSKYQIKAPATGGHPVFERAYRIQMNTLEQTVMFLPTLWLAARFGNPSWAGILGLIWLFARTWYVIAYVRDPAKRGPAFGLGMLAWGLLLLLAIYGVIRLFWFAPM